jgi:hypothetical protein
MFFHFNRSSVAVDGHADARRWLVDGRREKRVVGHDVHGRIARVSERRHVGSATGRRASG